MTTLAHLPRRGAPARERLLQTASRLFYDQGIRATGIDQIIAEAGVAKMSLYRHFPAKEDLVAAYLKRRHERWMADFRDGLRQYQLQGIAAPAAVALVLKTWFAQPDFRGCAFLNALAEGGRNPVILGIIRRHKAELRGLLADLVAPGLVDRDARGRRALLIVEGAIVCAHTERDPAIADDAGLLLMALARG